MSEKMTVAMIEGIVSRAKETVPTVLPYRGYYLFPIELNNSLSNNEKDAIVDVWEAFDAERDADCGHSETTTGG